MAAVLKHKVCKEAGLNNGDTGHKHVDNNFESSDEDR